MGKKAFMKSRFWSQWYSWPSPSVRPEPRYFMTVAGTSFKKSVNHMELVPGCDIFLSVMDTE